MKRALKRAATERGIRTRSVRFMTGQLSPTWYPGSSGFVAPDPEPRTATRTARALRGAKRCGLRNAENPSSAETPRRRSRPRRGVRGGPGGREGEGGTIARPVGPSPLGSGGEIRASGREEDLRRRCRGLAAALVVGL